VTCQHPDNDERLHAGGLSDQKRAANSKVVEMVLSGAKTAPKQQISANGSRTGADCDFSQLRQPASSD
jgi:hypothetical protein